MAATRQARTASVASGPGRPTIAITSPAKTDATVAAVSAATRMRSLIAARTSR